MKKEQKGQNGNKLALSKFTTEMNYYKIAFYHERDELGKKNTFK